MAWELRARAGRTRSGRAPAFARAAGVLARARAAGVVARADDLDLADAFDQFKHD